MDWQLISSKKENYKEDYSTLEKDIKVSLDNVLSLYIKKVMLACQAYNLIRSISDLKYMIVGLWDAMFFCYFFTCGSNSTRTMEFRHLTWDMINIIDDTKIFIVNVSTYSLCYKTNLRILYITILKLRDNIIYEA